MRPASRVRAAGLVMTTARMGASVCSRRSWMPGRGQCRRQRHTFEPLLGRRSRCHDCQRGWRDPWSTKRLPPTRHGRGCEPAGFQVASLTCPGGRRRGGGRSGRTGSLGMAGTADQSGWRLDSAWHHLPTAVDSVRTAGRGGWSSAGGWWGAVLGVRGVFVAQDGIGVGGTMPPVGVLRDPHVYGPGPVPAAPARLPHDVGIRLGGWRVVRSVGGPCPHEAVQAEGRDDDDGEDQEFHGLSLLPGGVADERWRRPWACRAPYT